MLNRDEPDDFVIATGKTHSIREFLEAAFSFVDLDWYDDFSTDPNLLRPAEVDVVRGDASKATRLLGWELKISFHELVQMMVEHDLEHAKAEP